MPLNQDNLPENKNTVSRKLYIGALLSKAVKLNRRFIDLQMKDFGLSRTQWQVLFSLNIIGNCTQKELLKNVDIDAGHLARVLEDLEAQKYIMRTPVVGNRRCLFIEVTKYAKKHLMPHIERLLTNEVAKDSVMLKGIKESDREILAQLLNKVIANIEAVLEINIIEGND